MTPEQALKCLLTVCTEYIGTLKDKPASQIALLGQIREAHGTLAQATQPEPDAKDCGDGTDTD